MNVQYKHEGKIINATLTPCGLFCDGCDWQEYQVINRAIFECSAHSIELTEWKGNIQAHPACQVEAQRWKK